MGVKQTFTRVAIVLISLNAVLAVMILALGRMGDTEGKILGTSLLATASALLAMVQVPALRGQRLGIAPMTGIAASGIGFLVVAVGMWTELESDTWWRLGGSGYIIAVAAAVAAILSGWPVRGRAGWVQSAALVLIGIGAAMGLGGIWLEIDNEAFGRIFAVVLVLVAAAGLAIPILHRSAVEEFHLSIEHCPFCGVRMHGETDSPLVCKACRRTFNVRVDA